MADGIKSTFDNISSTYDRQRRQLIPCYDDFYTVATTIAETGSREPEILDIGAGTGLLSSFLLQKYPTARMTLLDISDKMLEVARERFQAAPNIQFIAADYTAVSFEKTFDLVVSALSIHHLPDEQKKDLYRKVFGWLKPGGIFVNAEQVLGATDELDRLYKRLWKNSIEKSGLPKEEILAGFERMKLDKEATVEDQLKWLTEAGFSEVDCVYKYYNFSVLRAKKY